MITKEGFFDPVRFPIESVVQQSLSDNRQQYLSAVTLLRTMYNHGRVEAGVFLLGLLLSCGDDWKKRAAIVTALYDVQTEGCVKVLFGQLKSIKNSSATRGYLKEVIEVLSCMPPTLVRSGFEELVGDKTFTYRMRAKFETVVLYLADRQRHGLA